MNTTTARRYKRPSANGKSKLDRYAVAHVPIDSITPSPENEDIYGPIEHDDRSEHGRGGIRGGLCKRRKIAGSCAASVSKSRRSWSSDARIHQDGELQHDHPRGIMN